MTEQGSTPRRSARQPDLGRRGYDRPRQDRASTERTRADRPRRVERQGHPPGWGQDAFGPDTDTDADLPPWAGPSIRATRPAGTRLRSPGPAADYDYGSGDRADLWEGDERPEWPDEPVPAGGTAARPERSRRPGRPGRSGRRAAAARLRKSRRRVLRWCGLAIVVCVVAAVAAMILTHKTTPKLPYVTSLLHGEFKSVPNTCAVLTPAAIGQYLPGSHSTVQSLDEATDSECSFTVDGNHNFMILTLGAQSFQPFAAATGNGSASQNALDNFTADRVLFASPPKDSAVPKATIASLAGIGQRAFVAIQIEHTGGIARDVATVTVLERNDVLTVSMSAQESRGFGPVPVGTLQGDAQAVASSLLRKALAQPTA